MYFRALALAAAMTLGMTAAALPAFADVTLVDTGAPPQGAGNGGTLFGSTQWLAGEFTLAGAETITGIEGFIGTNFPFFRTFTIALRSDGGSIPGTELFSTTAMYSTNGWNGVSGLNWAVGPGTYWVAFEVRAGDTFAGIMPSGAPNPLVTEAFNTLGGPYRNSNNLDVGVRIFGGTVPEPAAWALMIMGFGGVGAMVRRRRAEALAA